MHNATPLLCVPSALLCMAAMFTLQSFFPSLPSKKASEWYKLKDVDAMRASAVRVQCATRTEFGATRNEGTPQKRDMYPPKRDMGPSKKVCSAFLHACSAFKE